MATPDAVAREAGVEGITVSPSGARREGPPGGPLEAKCVRECECECECVARREP